MASKGESSTSSGSSLSSNAAENKKFCRCGYEVPLLTAWTDKNAGRRFWSCPFPTHSARSCKYYELHDEPVNSWLKSLLLSYRRRIKDLENEVVEKRKRIECLEFDLRKSIQNEDDLKLEAFTKDVEFDMLKNESEKHKQIISRQKKCNRVLFICMLFLFGMWYLSSAW